MISGNQNSHNAPVTRSNSSGNQSQNKPHTYRVIKMIGEGSFGKAYLVECNSDKSLCVIKTINIDNMTDQEKKECLLEAKILEKLDHPNIIGFKEVFMAKRPTFTLNIVTDYADGGDLSSKIKLQKGKYFTENQVLDWFTQICLALKHIHDKKILHRDLKSQNIFLTENGMIKLGDFGIAKCLDYTWQKAVTVVGTPYYLSPEIVNNKPYSFKSDIWSLGVLLYEMAALKMPFDANSLPMLSLKIIKGQYNPLSSYFSKDLRTLVGMLLVVDQAKRPAINDILKLPIIKSRIKSFLNELEYNQEFSHTIIHKYNVMKDVNVKKRNSSSNHSIQNTQSTNISTQEDVKDNRKKNISPSPGKNMIKNNDNVKVNHNLVIHCKPQVPELRKREMDNKEIVDFMKKNDRKKNPTPNKDIKKTSSNNVVPDNQVNINANIKVQDNKNLDVNFQANPLLELMKRAKAVDEKCKVIPVINAEEKKIPDPEVKSNVIDISNKNTPQLYQHAVINNKVKNKKEAEEIYNLNRYLNELAKLEDEEPMGEDDEEEDSTDNHNNINPNLQEARDEDIVRESVETEIEEKQEKTKEVTLDDNAENTQIDELRVELENSLGFEVFKKIYKTVEEKTDPLLVKCDLEVLRELISTELSAELDQKKIDSAIEKIPEVFAIVVKERISNLKHMV